MRAVIVCVLAVIVFAVICLSKLSYTMYIQRRTHKVLRKHGYSFEDLKYTFDGMIYTISLPNHNPIIENAARADFKVEIEWESWLYPEILGLRVILKNDGAEMTVAFLRIDQFRLPVMDQLINEGKIDAKVYNLIGASKLIEKSTKESIMDEIYMQIHK